MILKNKLINFFKNSVFFYIIVFLFLLFLSFFPFFVVKNNTFNHCCIYFFLIFCSLIQVLIHILFFLHLNDYNKNYWNIFSIIFTCTIIIIIFTGSVWIMRNLNHHVTYI
ncbi:MAG: cytochrome o ubiquinol oxidase subunit IV [Buchnera aphidicola (Periphyllus lyropictus)]|uniref:cytochrome C oxidase subunit IV family protein n=1 Tax=Buchnera aphidicola TaxID=9 RepID=UPI001EB8CFA9|nr:cytochrome C oxidase subunit IV family protein [Buchnera aphidicola]NIH16522.1 cytochrome o ubiquinol oxidase subunit IV [Buchnera aphidicola (Periphyllus lyropictus)]USS94806.1 cytochrome C oxidase subunit IV family protein [Buchnera aphidicola (Periphyllus lyropictus)]